ncbi:tautomerase PptA [Escherichia coli]|uniref:tautomerase PptA n=2 Tax=Escherichia coli TaxID=562 RepID=UPI0024C21C9D|nr:tautomerase PptA [Escherichia coli]
MEHIKIRQLHKSMYRLAALAADITDVIIRHLNSKDSSISIALQQIQPESWQAIWDAEIAPQMEALIKKPGYSM